MSTFTESAIEQSAINWLEELGYGYTFDDKSCMLVSLRDSLLPKLMRGEVRVKA